MRRRKTGRDGFQGYSPTAAAAWERIFGAQDSDPAPTQESPATKSHKSPSDLYKEANGTTSVLEKQFYRENPFRRVKRPCDKDKACYCTGDCR